MSKKKKQKQLNVDEIVEDIISNLSPKMIKIFKNATPDEDGSYISEFHFGV